jgi:hypothetical protein
MRHEQEARAAWNPKYQVSVYIVIAVMYKSMSVLVLPLINIEEKSCRSSQQN